MHVIYGSNTPSGPPLGANIVQHQPSEALPKIPKPKGGLGEKDGYNMYRVLGVDKDEY